MKIEIKNGRFTFPSRDHEILHDINLSVSDGELLAILGANGSGKSTLLRCMIGLLTWNSGETLIDRVNIKDIPNKKLWQLISYVPQDIQMVPGYTVEEMVMLGRAPMIDMYKLPSEEDIKAVDEAIDRAGLSELRGRHVNHLSGGERRMVTIARALASGPKILALDEPEGNLDFKNQLFVQQQLVQLAEQGLICIYNTHNPATPLRYGSKVMLMSRQLPYKFGDAKEILTEENIRDYYGVNAIIGALAGNDLYDIIPVSVIKEDNK